MTVLKAASKTFGLWLLKKLSEKSTWAIVLTALATYTGTEIAPDLADKITQAGFAVALLVGALVDEETKPAA